MQLYLSIQGMFACASQFRLGDGLRDGTTLGPLINPKAVDFVQGHVDDAVQKGAKVSALNLTWTRTLDPALD